jgi:hypothetical protein
MQLLLQYVPLQPGDAPEAQLVRDHDEDVDVDDVLDMPPPLGPKRVVAVTDRGADLGTVHGTRGTLEELIGQGWQTPAGDEDIAAHLHEWASRWRQIEDNYFRSPDQALDEAAALLDDMIRERGMQADGETDDSARASKHARELAQRRRSDRQDVADGELNDAFNLVRGAFERIAAGQGIGQEPGQ